MRGREFKRYVRELLNTSDTDTIMNELREIPARRIVNTLFPLLPDTDPNIKWKAVTLMGVFVTRLAEDSMENARVIVRRLMWNLNDESGGIGWGCPEAMGEILCCHHGLAEEYSRILISYIRKDGNYQETELLQRGLLWGIGRLAQARPEYVRDSAPLILPYLESRDPGVRGLALWALNMLDTDDTGDIPERLKTDASEIRIYMNHRLVDFRIKDLAQGTYRDS